MTDQEKKQVLLSMRHSYFTSLKNSFLIYRLRKIEYIKLKQNDLNMIFL